MKLNAEDPFAVAAWNVLVSANTQSPEILANAIAKAVREELTIGTITGLTLEGLLPDAEVRASAERAELVVYTGWAYAEDEDGQADRPAPLVYTYDPDDRDLTAAELARMEELSGGFSNR